jgi:hypothetical protein
MKTKQFRDCVVLSAVKFTVYEGNSLLYGLLRNYSYDFVPLTPR